MLPPHQHNTQKRQRQKGTDKTSSSQSFRILLCFVFLFLTPLGGFSTLLLRFVAWHTLLLSTLHITYTYTVHISHYKIVRIRSFPNSICFVSNYQSINPSFSTSCCVRHHHLLFLVVLLPFLSPLFHCHHQHHVDSSARPTRARDP